MTTAIRSEATRAVVELDGVDRVAFNEDGSMELLTPAANPTGNKVPTAGQLPFTKEYVSPEQTITSAGGLTLPHGLGAAPKIYRCSLVCKTAEGGYSIGDVLEVPHTLDLTDTLSNSRGISLVGGTTNITIRFVSNAVVYAAIRKDNGSVLALTSANWRLIVRAWA